MIENIRTGRIAYLGLGSNLGDRAANLLRALSEMIAGELRLISVSSIYETDPVDHLDQPRFLNMAIAVTSESLEAFSLLNFCLEAELRLGRRRGIPKGARTIDIDLLMFDDLVVDDRRYGVHLKLPHPRLHLRRFVLAPLTEIAPHLRHPVFGQTMTELLGVLDDSSAVRVYR
jgi:2-amino-4-hydroxy-6-hydroxymethyldihydropteridine diphosphokinase